MVLSALAPQRPQSLTSHRIVGGIIAATLTLTFYSSQSYAHGADTMNNQPSAQMTHYGDMPDSTPVYLYLLLHSKSYNQLLLQR